MYAHKIPGISIAYSCPGTNKVALDFLYLYEIDRLFIIKQCIAARRLN